MNSLEYKDSNLRKKYAHSILSEMYEVSGPYVDNMRSEFRRKMARGQGHSVSGSLRVGFSFLLPSLPEAVSIFSSDCDVEVVQHSDSGLRPLTTTQVHVE